MLGIDVCIRKALIATCSADRSVRVWNYADHTLENKQEFFDEEVYSVAFHPSGFHLIASFTDKIRLLNLFESELICFKELPIKVIKFFLILELQRD